MMSPRRRRPVVHAWATAISIALTLNAWVTLNPTSQPFVRRHSSSPAHFNS